jgi:hypothetical protein
MGAANEGSLVAASEVATDPGDAKSIDMIQPDSARIKHVMAMVRSLAFRCRDMAGYKSAIPMPTIGRS